MQKPDLLSHLRTQKWAVASTASIRNAPESALVGIAVTAEFELVFDTLKESRKVANMLNLSAVSFVIGGWIEGDEQTVQYEGNSDFPQGTELDRLKAVYFAVFPDGRNLASDERIIYVRVKPTWIRYSNFNCSPPHIREFTFPQSPIK